RSIDGRALASVPGALTTAAIDAWRALEASSLDP
ncbi:MAG: hypothetical protein QOH64_2440, partial [Acidimicrobiaceae bacterium]